MKVGIDVSFKVCRTEGYYMAEGKSQPNPESDYIRFFCHYPAYVLEEIYGHERPFGVQTIMTDVNYTINELWELYIESKADIDNFIGGSHDRPVDLYDALWLASDIAAYKGLE